MNRIAFLLALILATSAQAAPEVTYCFKPGFDNDCSLGDSSSSATITENLWGYLVDVHAKSAASDSQEDNWCVLKTKWSVSLVSGPNVPVVGFQHAQNLADGVGYIPSNPDGTNWEHAFYLLDSSSDDSIVDGTTEVTLGRLRFYASTLSSWPGLPAPCDDSVVKMTMKESPTYPYWSGISETYVGSEWSCGGVDNSDGMSVSELVNHERDQDIDTPTTLDLTIITDQDHDFIPNDEDNCIYNSNYSQTNTNEGTGAGLDLQGNACDADWSNNGEVGPEDFLILSAEWGCSTTKGKCDDTHVGCTLAPDNCATGTCVACFDPEHDSNDDDETSSAEMVLLSAQWGYDQEDMTGQNTCAE